MRFTVTLKLWFPKSPVRWACRYIVEASCVEDALFEAELIMRRDEEFAECKIIESRVSEYEANDEYRYLEDVNRWELEEKQKAAPAEIARALNRIADKMGYSSPAPQPQLQPIVQDSGMKPYMIGSIICSIASVVSLILSILLR